MVSISIIVFLLFPKASTPNYGGHNHQHRRHTHCTSTAEPYKAVILMQYILVFLGELVVEVARLPLQIIFQHSQVNGTHPTNWLSAHIEQY